MSEFFERHRGRIHAGVILLLFSVIGLLVWRHEAHQKPVASQAGSTDEVKERLRVLEEERVWERVQEAEATLSRDQEDPGKRREAIIRMREALKRLKQRYGYPQLGEEGGR